MCGLRVKITYTFSAAGNMAPIFILVLGINARDIPKDTIFLIKIKGIYVGGGGANVGAQHYVMIKFTPGENAMDNIRYKIYRDKIIIPFIAQARVEHGKCQVGMPITKELKAFSWCGGYLTQIDNIINYTYLKNYKEDKISVQKQNAELSATEQATDLAKVFKIIPEMEQNIIVSNIPHHCHPMKCTIYF